jgi:hypothetical protein
MSFQGVKGKGKRDDIIDAGGCAIDRSGYKRNGSDSRILSFALEG